ncbi:MAG: hypothetical protein BGO57_12610 [Sphingomonadales bacterium 63-6]|nr:MAG: hypothetical protein BGO57_12610 [Sphingomonadales bacterium 63-6]
MSDPVASETEAQDIRPVVRTAGTGNTGLWIFLGVLLLGGGMLFQALNARRLDATAPVTQYASGGATISSLPPLALPAEYQGNEMPALPPAQQLLPAQPVQPAPYFPERAVTRIVEVPVQAASTQSAPMVPADMPVLPPRPAIIYDAAVTPVAARAEGQAGPEDERVTATRLKNPSVTVPKGTVIPAVLETAMDSTRPGAARALVTRDVMGFDGSRILIPRGSRLYGEYEADLNYGQNRAMVRWNRLLRPDGAMINLDSPAADPLGRAGIRGKVNTHFWARFGGAILQSVLDIGVGVATRKIDDAVVVALPGSTQNISRTATEGMSQVRPTLKVNQGTSVSVFVAKDLDFSTVEQ